MANQMCDSTAIFKLVQLQKSSASFCIESEEHVATNGPKVTNIIQYFAWKKFTEMTPSDRNQELKRQVFCIQCLFSGAMQNSGKHNDDKCQRKFICKEKSHNKFPTKKHVLVCHEHTKKNENQQLLQKLPPLQKYFLP